MYEAKGRTLRPSAAHGKKIEEKTKVVCDIELFYLEKKRPLSSPVIPFYFLRFARVCRLTVG